MSAMASQITGVSIVCLAVCSGAGQRKHQRSASLAFVRGSRWAVDSLHKEPVTRKIFPFDVLVKTNHNKSVSVNHRTYKNCNELRKIHSGQIMKEWSWFKISMHKTIDSSDRKINEWRFRIPIPASQASDGTCFRCASADPIPLLSRDYENLTNFTTGYIHRIFHKAQFSPLTCTPLSTAIFSHWY